MTPIAFLLTAALLTMPNTPREKLLFDFGWRFHLGHAADTAKDFGYGTGNPFHKAGNFGGPAALDFDDSAWRTLDLPHDWAVEQELDPHGDGNLCSHGFRKIGGHYPELTIGWYRRVFEVPRKDLGRRVVVEFDGVFRDSIVWLNGHQLARHLGGYTGFRIDLTDYLNYGGKNVLTVRVDASQMEGWFYEGAGIYRHVWLIKTAPVHVAPYGVFVTSKVNKATASLSAQVTVQNESDEPAKIDVETTITGPDGKPAGIFKFTAKTLAPWAEGTFEAKTNLTAPKLWSIEEPNVYSATTTVKTSGSEADRIETAFGIRTVRFDKDKGFFLNGKPVKIKGVCCHHDHAGVGSALPDRINVFRIERLKEMGCNGYRSSHNPPTSELLDACDRLGMIVMDENRLIGANPETLEQLAWLVKRDRNRPSVVLWSIGNEESLQGTPESARFAKTMIRTIKALDPTRSVTYAGNNGNQWKGVNSIVDVRGWNYVCVGDIDKYHKEHPEQPIVGSEEASTVSTRGEYAKDPEKGYVSAYDANTPGWGALAEQWWKYFMARPYAAGAFVWTGFDYRGEPTPYAWPCVNSHFGIIDTCGFPKDNFFYYQARWTDKPVLHILPDWNRPAGEVDVWVQTNCEKVELLLNGRSLGTKKLEPLGHLEWKVPFEAGKLEARGVFQGKSVTAAIETTGKPAAIELTPDRATLAADGEDVAMVTVSVVDDAGRLVPFASNEVSFELEGDARIIGVGNGDPSCHEADVCLSGSWKRSVFHGLAQVIVRVGKSPGAVTLRAAASGLKPVSLAITLKKTTPRACVK